MAVSRIFCATGLIGGNDGDLDTIDGQNLADKDMAIAIDQTTVYFYALDADIGDGLSPPEDESSPNLIAPNDNPGTKRWVLQSLYANDLTLSDDIILVTDDVEIGNALTIGDTVFTDGVITDATGLSIAANVDVTGTHGASTYTADTNFTVGGTVITDNTITDDGTLIINPTTSLQITGGSDPNLVQIGSNDSQYGRLQCLGDGASSISGGSIFLNTAADYDGTGINYFSIQVSEDNLNIGPNQLSSALQFIGSGADATPWGSWVFNAPVDVDAALSATTVDADTDFTVGGTVITNGTITDDGTLLIDAVNVRLPQGNLLVGTDDSVNGVLTIYSDSGLGGTLRIHTETDFDTVTNYYQFQCPSGRDDLYIGTDDDSDMMVFNDATSISFTVPVDVDAALTATTVDADTDFTVGTTVITSGDINDTSLNLSGGPVSVTGGSLYLGLTDNTRGGLYIYASATGGGFLRTYVDTDDDDTIDYYTFQAVNDDLWIGPDTDTDALVYDGGTNQWHFTAGNDEVQFLTKIRMGDAIHQEWDPVPASDDTMSGDVTQETVDANATGIGAVLVLSADGNWDEADASAVATIGQLGLAVESGTGTKYVMWKGWAKDTAWSWTPGAQLFVSETTGAITATAPSTSGAFVQVVGYATSATTIYFNPSPDYIEVA